MTDVPRLQGPGRQNDPGPFADLVQQLQGLKQQVDDQSGSILKSSGISAEPGIIRVLGSLLVEGNLSVPNGSIDNAALATPVGWGYQTNVQTGFGLTTAFQSLAPADLVVPDGFNSAILMVYGIVLALNATGSGSDWIWVEAGIAGQTNGGMPTLVGDGAWGTQSILGVLTRTGLTAGQTISTAVRAYGQQHAWPANAGARAYTRTVALYLRA